MKSDDFQKLKETWEELGEKDPLWAVVSHDNKRGGKWDPDDFLRTGEDDVSRYHALLIKHTSSPKRFRRVLDFGCGVGRLCMAWSRRAENVVGIDISQPMLQKARSLLADVTNVEFKLNLKPDLSCFQDNEFDLVASHICLQHMPWEIASGYVREFGRVCNRGGWVTFQVPTRGGTMQSRIRQKLVEALPFGLSKVYRQWRHGAGVVFGMYYTEPAEVIKVAASAGLKLVHKEADPTCGKGEEGFIYIFSKS